MKAIRTKLLGFGACLVLLLAVHQLTRAWLANGDPLTLFLRASDPLVVPAVLVLLGARFALLFLLPGWGLYLVLAAFGARSFELGRAKFPRFVRKL